jgi:hypothetical protein
LNPPCLFKKSIDRSHRTLHTHRSRANKPSIPFKWCVSPCGSEDSLDGLIRKPP